MRILRENLFLCAMELINNGLGENKNGGYDRVDRWDEKTTAALTEHYREILRLLGQNGDREGLKETPTRVAKAMQFLTQGHGTDPADILRTATFHEDYSEMVIVKDIELFSMCEHHMLPFIGKAHVAYIPDGRITGLSKIARVVDGFARRLQLQERLTVQIRDCIHETLEPLGVAVVIEALHLCMVMRGVQKQHSVTTTSAFTGAFMKAEKTREEFLRLVGTKLS